jgi:arabinofuranosyltransferase
MFYVSGGFMSASTTAERRVRPARLTRLKRSLVAVNSERQGRGVLVLFLAFYVFIVVKNLWISDDAYITFRTVDNFLHGYGLTWNTDERVQSFTHPLWLFLLSGINLVIPNIYFAALILAISCSIAAVAIFAFGIAGSRALAVLGLLALTTSKAFVDYSTSGLENPLTHLLLALFAFVYLRSEQERTTFASYAITAWEERLLAGVRRVGARIPWVRRLDRQDRLILLLGILAGLATLNRMDVLLIFAPALLHALWQLRRLRGVWLVAMGFVPFGLWEAFSVWYYGFLFPNTAYAKLNTGIPARDYLVYGMHYLWDSAVRFDPVLLFIPVGLCLPLVFKGRRSVPLALGALLYLGYVVKIGGDFMAGRFLTAVLLLALILLSRIPRPTWVSLSGAALGLAFLVCALAGFVVTNATVYALRERDYHIRYYRVIGDERSAWAGSTSIQTIGRYAIPHDGHADQGRQARAQGKTFVIGDAVGFLGFEAGPHVHVEDIYALNDPLLARLPTGEWVIGHFPRQMPPGYLQTVETGANVIQDPGLAAYYDKLHLITSGNLLDLNRMIAIYEFNTGQFDALLQPYKRQLPSPQPYTGPIGHTQQRPAMVDDVWLQHAPLAR